MNLSSARVERLPSSTWWSIVLRGVLAFVFGLIALANPGNTAAALVIVFAVYALIDGGLALALSARRGRAGERWGWFLVEGLVSIAAGIFALAYPAATFYVLLLVVAIRAIVLGGLELGGAITGKALDSRWLWALAGVVSIVFGVMLLSRPLAGAVALVWMIGAYAVVAGIMTFAFGLHVRGLHRHEEEPQQLGGHAAAT